MTAFITALVVAQEHIEEPQNDPEHLYPHVEELIIGAVAFAVLFFFVWKWVLPRLGKILEERRQKIQGSLEEAEGAKRDADQLLAEYQQKLRDAGSEAGRIIEESRKTAEQMRKDLLAKAEDESRQIVAKAQEEVRAERDRAVQALRRELAEASVELAARVVGETLDKDKHVRLVEQFIDDVKAMQAGNGEGR
ncbi:MAG: F0F1 ATP synthase subunit B [Actinomycetota bacterium]